MKAFTKILCLLLAMMMVLSLAACSKDDDGDKGDDKQKETVADKDTGKEEDKDTDKEEDKDTDKEEDKDTDKDIDKEETVVGTWEYTMPNELFVAALGLTGIELDLDAELIMLITFDEDGSGNASLDEDSLEDWAEEVAVAMLDVMAEQYDMSVSDLLEMMEMTQAEYVEEVIETMDLTSAESEFTYTISGNKMTMSEDSEDSVATFKFESGKLVLTGVEDAGDMPEEILDLMFPMTLERVK